MAVRLAARVTLAAGRDRPARGGNPWIFSNAIASVDPREVAPGALVSVHDCTGALVGMAYYNPATTIALRMLAWNETPALEDLIDRRLRSAIALRERVVGNSSNCMRLVNGEGDGMPGVVVDRYDDILVLQILTAGAERMRDTIVARLGEIIHPRAILERSAGAVRQKEGLPDRIAPAAGEAIASADVVENGIRIQVDFDHGQKTGYFLDQRGNRAIAGRMARGARVLDLYCYAGGFSLAALTGGAAHATAVDTSARAIEWARRNADLNGIEAGRIDFVHGDAADFLGKCTDRFDLIILDPPAYAKSRGDAERASRMYAEMNAMAIRALAPQGRIMTFSCSIHLHGEDFVRAVRFGAARAGRGLRVLAHLGPGMDHPAMLGHIEGEYLSGLLMAEI